MRKPLFLSVFVLTPFAQGQFTVGTNEVKIQQAMQSSRTDNPLMLEMTGSQRVGSAVVPIHAVLYWRTSYDPRTQKDSKVEVELDVSRYTQAGEVPSLRIVGDGVVLRRYDLDRREVSTTKYGFYGAAVPPNYPDSDAPKLLVQLKAATPGPANYLARLVSDMLPAGPNYSASYSTWMPGVASRSLMEIMPVQSGGTRQLNGMETSADDTVPEPITGRVYLQGLSEWVSYNLDAKNPSRTLVFELSSRTNESSGDAETYIKRIDVADRIASGYRSLSIVPKSLFVLPTYAFVPYSGTAAASFTPLAQPGAGY